MNFSIFGAGAWGTAMGIHLCRNGQNVTLIPRCYKQALALTSLRENQLYLPGVPLGNQIQIASEPKPALMESEVILVACPVAGLKELGQTLSKSLDSAWRAHTFLTLCKGWEAENSLPPPNYLKTQLQEHHVGVLSGPNNALEIANGKPAAIVLATQENPNAKAIQLALSNESLRVYTSNDVEGVSLGGALKNIYAIGAGICSGLDLGDNAIAAFLTRALNEMVRLGTALGGQPETFYGLSGFGDLIATSTGPWSRNRTFGNEIGKGIAVETLLKDRRTVVEGYKATHTFHGICQAQGIDAPILKETHGILFDGRPPATALQKLMNRDLKAES
ncbi:MAG: NAD(P)-dependent glycerol-3-phosphate dehydrogenase [Opitutae bacterium]|jgi:glycerol-3-phosphate dehydrogenase (NAD(P)+)|nr:NAD(P)-dependent glycerol-3-phosphate dehydrogenase [Opitutae bacterium]MBT4223067.1 NAD(P)-dependent glycerol-3-phosphate dehydrogenase [Opitutae bacterium]MBT5381147.1 NAD(P)-dependent glycerol-3-phosphate dehydrogenase [Opitutae bacterium]MBT5692593.1 NAD(P)-dependent glycerol-3-phosphate dehydrogenase [Opitutae bacterium]MBT6462222.1 NAD(P)-dependent glycerol-3-phosphate dehydrogenase [Opitutae bacterium]